MEYQYPKEDCQIMIIQIWVLGDHVKLSAITLFLYRTLFVVFFFNDTNRVFRLKTESSKTSICTVNLVSNREFPDEIGMNFLKL